MKKTFLALLTVLLMTAACGQKQPAMDNADNISVHQNVPGDSSIYGLACDGTTDSILVFLPYAGGNPDTFDIIDARQEHRIYGRPLIGDQLAVVLRSDSDTTAASSYPVVDFVVNLNQLQDQWNYMVVPTLRTSAANARPLPDSIRQRILVPREYSIRLRRGGAAFATGMPRQQTSDDRSPVVYPPIKRYTSWRLSNGQLILQPDSASQLPADTAAIVLLRRDTLVLRFADHEQGYYRKKQ